MFTTVVISSLIAFSHTAHADNKVNEPKVLIKLSRALVSQSPTVKALLKNLLEYHLISRVEVSSIESYLISKRISLDTTLALGKQDGDMIRWDNLSLTWNDGAVLKTNAGEYLRLNKKSLDKIFIETFEALSARQKESSALWRLLLPEASADGSWYKYDEDMASINRRISAASNALASGALVAKRVWGTIGNGIVAAFSGAVALPMAILIRNFQSEFVCENGKYYQRLQYSDQERLDQKSIYSSGAKKKLEDRFVLEKDLIDIGYSPDLKGLRDSNVEAYLRLYFSGEVPTESLRKIWPGETVPTCTPLSLKKVADQIKAAQTQAKIAVMNIATQEVIQKNLVSAPAQ